VREELARGVVGPGSGLKRARRVAEEGGVRW
jgi:hypothetical protein